MNVFVAAVSSEQQYAKGLFSFTSLTIRDGDKKAVKFGARGDIARATLGETFLDNKQFDAILLLDLDMTHPPDLLERLRAHDVDMVSAHYFRRHIDPMRSVVSVLTKDDSWPYPPLIDIPDDGLHEIACTGFGCVLIKREVVEAVKSMLPPGSPIFSLGPMPEEANNEHGQFGSDFNFFMRARKAGYKLWLDASLESKHAVTVWIGREYYGKLGVDDADFWNKFWRHTMAFNGINQTVLESRAKVLQENIAKLQARIGQLDAERDRLEKSIILINGQLTETQMYLKEYETLGRGDMYKIGNLPVYESDEDVRRALQTRGDPPHGMSEQELKNVREKLTQKNSMDIANAVSGREEEA